MSGSALSYACEGDQIEIVEILVKSGANLKYANYFYSGVEYSKKIQNYLNTLS